MLRTFCKRLEELTPSLRPGRVWNVGNAGWAPRPGAQRRAASAPRPLTSGHREAGLLAGLEDLTQLWPWAPVLPEAQNQQTEWEAAAAWG